MEKNCFFYFLLLIDYLPVRMYFFVMEKNLNTPSTLKFFQLLKHSILFHIFKVLSMISLCLEHCLCRHLRLAIHLASLDFFVTFSWKPALSTLPLPVTLQSWAIHLYDFAHVILAAQDALPHFPHPSTQPLF